MKISPESAIVKLREADRLSEDGKNDEASALLQELEQISSHHRDVATLRLKRAIVMTNAGKTSDAQELISTVDPDLLSEEYRLSFKFETGRIKAAQGETEDAIMVLTQALRDADGMIVSGDLEFVRQGMILLLGTLLCDSGKPTRAIPFFSQIHRGTHGWERAWRSLGDCYFEMFDYKEAIKFYGEVVNAKEDISELERNIAIRNIGAAYCHLRDFRRAAQYLELALVKFNDFPERKREIEEMMRVCSANL